MIELAGIVILGILAQWFAWRTRVPAILPLIIIGLLVGPISTLWTEGGRKLIEPIFNGTYGLFPGEGLFYFVSLAIGVILFEGGLTLRRKEIKGMAPVIGKLISLGSTVTFLGGGLAAHFIIGLNWPLSFLFSGLIIVTGPTVIAPILRNVPLNRKVATVLKWEGILIDPIGALVAVLVFEFIISGTGGGEFGVHALTQFFIIAIEGIVVGGLAGYLLYQSIKRQWVPHYLLNVFILASVLLVFVVSDLIVHESGLLAVVITGMVLAELEVPKMEMILDFKESMSVLLISILFILLSANINLSDLQLLLGWRPILLFIVVILILRPLSVFISARDSELTKNEKTFISWVGPRGIVAAGIASLFGIRLTQLQYPGAEYITPLVFMIVLGTVLLNATTARIAARLLGVIQQSSSGILILGSNLASRVIAKYLQENGRHVVIIDNNPSSIAHAQKLGLEGVRANIYQDDLNDHLELLDMGYLLAMTSNGDVNKFACNKLSTSFGENGTFRLITPEEMLIPNEELTNKIIFSQKSDFIKLNELLRNHSNFHEIEINSFEDFQASYKMISESPKAIPLFYRDGEGQLQMITARHDYSDVSISNIVYVGQEIQTSK